MGLGYHEIVDWEHDNPFCYGFDFSRGFRAVSEKMFSPIQNQ